MDLPGSFIKLNRQNISEQHICCAFSDKKCRPGYENKKKWLQDQFDEGYTFYKLNVRGKVFIEYCPSEICWLPVDADNYTAIACFWVSGKYKGQGHAKALLKKCIDDSSGKNGIFAVVANKKQPFMSDKKFLIMQGFEVCDTALPYFELLYKPLKKDAPKPSFKDIARNAKCNVPDGLAVYYSPACPFNDYYVNTEMKKAAEKRGIPIYIKKLENRVDAQNHFVPHAIYSVFYNGNFVTQHIINEKQFDRFIEVN